MRRKIIKQRDSYTITLPIKWVKENNISKDAEVDIEENENTLVLMTSQTKKMPKKVELVLESSYPAHIINLIRNLYLNAYDIIEIRFNKEEDIIPINEIVKTLIGYEIIEQDDLKCIIKDISSENEGDFDVMYRKMWRIVRLMGDFLLESLSNGFSSINDTKIRDLNFDNSKFSSYCRRLLYKNSIIKSDKGLSDYIIITYVHMIGRNFYWIQEYISKNKFSIKNETIKFLKEFLLIYDAFYEFYYSDSEISGKKIKEMTDDMVKRAYDLLSNDRSKNSCIIYRLTEANRFIHAAYPKIEVIKIFKKTQD